jgi:hypothetical protein
MALGSSDKQRPFYNEIYEDVDIIRGYKVSHPLSFILASSSFRSMMNALFYPLFIQCSLATEFD